MSSFWDDTGCAVDGAGGTAPTRPRCARAPQEMRSSTTTGISRVVLLLVVGELRLQPAWRSNRLRRSSPLGDDGARLVGLDAELDRDQRVGEQVVVPGWVLGSAGLGGEYHHPLAVGEVHHGRRAALAACAAPIVLSSSTGVPSNGPPTRPPRERNSWMIERLKALTSATAAL